MRPHRLRLRRWDDEVVVYDDLSGDTHLLNDLCGRVLERLMVSGAAEDDLIERCGAAAGAQEGAAGALYPALDRLRHLGLVKPLLK